MSELPVCEKCGNEEWSVYREVTVRYNIRQPPNMFMSEGTIEWDSQTDIISIECAECWCPLTEYTEEYKTVSRVYWKEYLGYDEEPVVDGQGHLVSDEKGRIKCVSSVK